MSAAARDRGLVAPAAARPSPKLPRIKRVEELARRAEELQSIVADDIELSPFADLVAEMGRELYRMAHALDGVV